MATAKKSNIGNWILGGVIAYGLLQYWKFVDKQTMQLTDIGFNGSYIDAQFLINNPTDLSGTVDNLAGELQYKGSPIATVNTNYQNIIVPAGLPFSATVKMQPNYTNVFNNALQLITNRTFKKEDLRFVGKMIFSGIPIPVNTSLI